MKFPRNARMLRGQLDAAPFAGVLFCLLIFVLLCSLVYTPGVQIQLPVSGVPVSSMEGPKISVALDASGNLYYQNQLIQESNLVQRMKLEVRRHTEPLTLVVVADKQVTTGQVGHLQDLAISAGIQSMMQQRLPPLFDKDTKKKP